MMSKLVFILTISLFAFCGGEPECGTNQCKDLWVAKKCNKVKYCIAEEWSKIEPTGKRDNVCEICLKMVKEARDTLQSNETREELKQVLEGSCALLGFKPVVKLCDKLMDELEPELVDTLSSQMDPETVCSVARLCNNAEFWTAHKNSKECVHCEAFTEIAEKDVESVTPDEFRNGFLSVCRTAGSFSDACSQIGTEFSGVLHSTAKTILRNKPCETISLCPSGSKSEPSDSQLTIKIRGEMCPFCKTVMKSVREKFLRVRSAEEFAEKMSTACNKMNFSNSTCSVVSSPAFYDKLKSSEWLPNLFCSVTFCVEKPDEEVPVWPLLPSHMGSFKSSPALDIMQLLENIELFFQPMKQEETEAARPVISYGDPIENPVFFSPSLYTNQKEECEICHLVADYLLQSRNLDNVCRKIKVKGCKQFVEKYHDFLIIIIQQNQISHKLCQILVPSCPVTPQEKPSAEASANSCSFCLNVMKVLKHADSYFWGRALEDKCNDLHKSSQEKCKNLSSLFVSFPSLFKNSTKEIEACSHLKLCGSSSAALTKSDDDGTIKSVKSDCQNCMLAVQTVTDFLKSNQSSILIENLLDAMCTLLSHEKRVKCEELVKIIGVDGLKEIIKSFTPDEVCSKVHMCGRRTDINEISKESTEIQKPEEKVPCKFCLMAIKMLIDELQDDKTEESIRRALDGLCNYFPEETRDTCKNLIDEYAEDIIDMIVADFNATEICTYLRICPPRQLLENSLGKEITVFDVETNELRDWTEASREPLLEFTPRIGIVKLEEPKEEDFFRFRQIVQDCALCEALVGVIASHQRMLSKNYDFPANSNFICSIVPANKRRQCMSMAISYGPSIVNLIVDQHVKPNDVCVRLDICDPKMQAKVNQPVSVSEDKIDSKGSNDCLRGPVFWCANAENAEKCGTFLHCQETVWKNWKSPPTRTN